MMNNMMNPWAKGLVEQRFKIARIVWFAFMASPLLFAFLLSQNAGAPVEGAATDNHLLMPFALVALTCLVMSRILPEMLLKNAIKQIRAEPLTEDGMRAVTYKGRRVYKDEDIPKYLALEPGDQLMVRASGPYFTMKIVQFALCESAATLGFVLAHNSHSLQLFFPFGAAAMLGLAISGPSSARLSQLVREPQKLH